ncbi:MAG: Fur family transcriptional regulator [Candidatus Woesearchaeota archaeon]
MISRQTKQKEIISKKLKEFKGFFSAKELHEQAKKEDKKIGIATIYRFLKDEVENQKLHTYVCGRKNVYSKNKTHCHFVDEKTGKITHFQVETLDFLKGQNIKEITSVHIEVKGKK